MKKNHFTFCVMLFTGITGSFALPINQKSTDTTRTIILEDAVVTATRAGKNAPVAYKNILKKEIERSNYGRDITSLLQATPSMVATSDAGNGIGYTDIRLRGTDGTRINVTMNGVPMNDAESHKVYWVDTPDIISSLASIQIQRGVGTSTNGAGAFGGSINMTTSALPLQMGGEASFSYGSYTTNKEAIKLSSGLIGKWAFDGRFSHIFSHGYMDRAFANLSSYMLQAGYYDTRTTWKFISFGGHERTYNAWDGLSKEQMSKYGRTYNPCGEITHNIGGETMVTGFYHNQTDNYTQVNNQIIMSHVFNNNWDWNFTAHYTRGNGYYNQWKNNRKLAQYGLSLTSADGTPLKKSNLTRKKQMDNDFYGAVASVNFRADNLVLNLGGAGNLYTGNHWGNVMSVESAPYYNDNAEYYRNNSRKSDINAFAKATWSLLPFLSLCGDVQYRHIRSEIYGTGSSYQEVYDASWNEVGYMQPLHLNKAYDFVNPKIGINYSRNNHNLYASFGIAQKEPTRDDFVNAMKGQEPKKETLYDWETGYRFQNEYLNAGVNLYWMQYRDQLILTGGINTETYDPLYFNAPKSFRYGAELTIEAKPLSFLTIEADANFSRNRINDYTESIYSNDSYTNIDRYVGNTDIAYSPSVVCGGAIRFEKSNIEAGFSMKHVGSQYINNSSNSNLKLDAYTVGNLELAYTFLMKGVKSIRLGVNINNVFNNHYCSNAYIYESSTTADGGDVYDIRYFPQATRNFLANLTVKF